MLNECMSRKISGSSLITATTTELPDPGSVLALIEKLNQAYLLKIDTAVLKKSAEEFHAQLNEIMDQYRKVSSSQGGKSAVENMYG